MHLSSEEALDLIEQRVPEAQAAFWTAHFEACSDCSKQFQDWKELHSLMKRTHLESAPEADLRLARAIYQPAAGEKRSVREIIASIAFDSFTQPALAGARGTAGARQYLLRADEFDIHLRLSGASPERRLSGQILSRGEKQYSGPAQLHLLRGDERVETTKTDPSGEFQFIDVPEGPLSLQIDFPNLTVVGRLN